MSTHRVLKGAQSNITGMSSADKGVYYIPSDEEDDHDLLRVGVQDNLLEAVINAPPVPGCERNSEPPTIRPPTLRIVEVQ